MQYNFYVCVYLRSLRASEIFFVAPRQLPKQPHKQMQKHTKSANTHKYMQKMRKLTIIN